MKAMIEGLNKSGNLKEAEPLLRQYVTRFPEKNRVMKVQLGIYSSTASMTWSAPMPSPSSQSKVLSSCDMPSGKLWSTTSFTEARLIDPTISNITKTNSNQRLRLPLRSSSSGLKTPLNNG